MADETSASAMVTYFTTCTAQLRGRAVFIQFSNHKELKTDQTHSNAVSLHVICIMLKLLFSEDEKVFVIIIFFLSEIEFHNF